MWVAELFIGYVDNGRQLSLGSMCKEWIDCYLDSPSAEKCASTCLPGQHGLRLSARGDVRVIGEYLMRRRACSVMT